MHLITTTEAAQVAGISPATWRYYQNRRTQHGKGEIPAPIEYHGRTAMYDEAAVRAWVASRPGRGTRTDLTKDKS